MTTTYYERDGGIIAGAQPGDLILTEDGWHELRADGHLWAARVCPTCNRPLRWCVCDWRTLARDGARQMLDDLDEQRREWCYFNLWKTAYRLDFTADEVWQIYEAAGYNSAAASGELDAELAARDAYRRDYEQTVRDAYYGGLR